MRDDFRAVCDLVEDALIRPAPDERRVAWANRTAIEGELVNQGEWVAAAVLDAVRRLPPPTTSSGVPRPTCSGVPIVHAGRSWLVRAHRFADGAVIVCRRRAFDEREVLERFARAYGLTARRLDILRQLLRGKSNVEIAAALGLSHATERRYVSELLAALGVESRHAVFELRERLLGR